MKKRFPRVVRKAVPAVAAACVSCAAHAEVSYAPYASASYAHSTNLFALPDGSPAPFANGEDHGLDDSYRSYSAGLNVTGTYGRQQLSFQGHGTKVDYDQYTRLDHTEYGADGAWNWRLLSMLDGVLGYGQQKQMVPFSDALSNQLLVETQKHGNVGVNVTVTPHWRLETRASRDDRASPRPGAPDLDSKETLVGGGVRYLGTAKFTGGIDFSHTKGDVSGFLANTDQAYVQRAGQFNANYQASPQSSVSGAIGYTKRDNEGGGNVDAVTGSLSVSHQISVKTSLNLQAFRQMNSYLFATQVQTEIDTGITAGASWAPTRKLSLGLNVTRSKADFPEVQSIASLSNRKDNFWSTTLDVSFQALRWLQIHPYGRYEKRHSNDPRYPYDNTVWGLEFRAAPSMGGG